MCHASGTLFPLKCVRNLYIYICGMFLWVIHPIVGAYDYAYDFFCNVKEQGNSAMW